MTLKKIANRDGQEVIAKAIKEVAREVFKLDEKVAAVATSEANALTYKNAAANSATNASNSASSASTFATNASNSASSASTTARVLTDIYNEAIASGKIVAPAVDPTLTISGAAADSKVCGETFSQLNDKEL